MLRLCSTAVFLSHIRFAATADSHSSSSSSSSSSSKNTTSITSAPSTSTTSGIATAASDPSWSPSGSDWFQNQVGQTASAASAAAPTNAAGNIYGGVGAAASSLKNSASADASSAFYNGLAAATATTLPPGMAALLSSPQKTGLETAEASEVVSGIIEAFLGTSNATEDESACLASGAEKTIDDISQLCMEMLAVYRQMRQSEHPAEAQQLAGQLPAAQGQLPSAGSGNIPPVNPFMVSAASTTIMPSGNSIFSLGTAAQATSRRLQGMHPMIGSMAAQGVNPQAESPMAVGGMSAGSASVISMMLMTKMTSLYEMEIKIAKSCLKHDVILEMEEAGVHLMNATYVGGRLVSNGVDILEELTDAFSQFEQKNFKGFGHDVGAAWFKVLLAKRSKKDMHLKKPSAKSIELVTEGLFSAFFGTGFHFKIATDAIPLEAAIGASSLRGNGAAAWPVPAATAGFATTIAPTLHPPMELNIDLKTCVTGNLPLLKSAWTPVWEIMSKALEPNATTPQMSELMMTMMDMQLALTRCGIGPLQETVLIDALESGSLHTQLGMPDQKVTSEGISKMVAVAIKDFEGENWFDFGAQLGKVLQDMLVATFPQKYEVDLTGQLKNSLVNKAQFGDADFARRQAVGSSWCLYFAGVMSVSLAVAAVVRARRSVSAYEKTLPLAEVDREVEALE